MGFNTLTVGAEPYIGVAAIFDQVIQPYLRTGAITSSSTAVTAASPAAPVVLTLQSATGFAIGQRIIVDVDARQEAATVADVTGSTITLQLSKAHSGTYPVTVEGGESIVRSLLARCRDIGERIGTFAARAGLKSVDKEDVVFFGSKGEANGVDTLIGLQNYWRGELCRCLFGVGNIRELRTGGRGGGGGKTSVY